MRCFKNAEKNKKKEGKKRIRIAPGVRHDRQATAEKATDAGVFPFKTNMFVCYVSKTQKKIKKIKRKKKADPNSIWCPT